MGPCPMRKMAQELLLLIPLSLHFPTLCFSPKNSSFILLYTFSFCPIAQTTSFGGGKSTIQHFILLIEIEFSTWRNFPIYHPMLPLTLSWFTFLLPIAKEVSLRRIVYLGSIFYLDGTSWILNDSFQQFSPYLLHFEELMETNLIFW